MTEWEEYSLYKRCKICGQILTDFEIDDNRGLCDFCFNDMATWIEYPFGEYEDEI